MCSAATEGKTMLDLCQNKHNNSFLACYKVSQQLLSTFSVHYRCWPGRLCWLIVWHSTKIDTYRNKKGIFCLKRFRDCIVKVWGIVKISINNATSGGMWKCYLCFLWKTLFERQQWGPVVEITTERRPSLRVSQLSTYSQLLRFWRSRQITHQGVFKCYRYSNYLYRWKLCKAYQVNLIY